MTFELVKSLTLFIFGFSSLFLSLPFSQKIPNVPITTHGHFLQVKKNIIQEKLPFVTTIFLCDDDDDDESVFRSIFCQL